MSLLILHAGAAHRATGMRAQCAIDQQHWTNIAHNTTHVVHTGEAFSSSWPLSFRTLSAITATQEAHVYREYGPRYEPQVVKSVNSQSNHLSSVSKQRNWQQRWHIRTRNLGQGRTKEMLKNRCILYVSVLWNKNWHSHSGFFLCWCGVINPYCFHCAKVWSLKK